MHSPAIMSNQSEANVETDALRQAFAELQAQLDHQEHLLKENFRNVRAEMDSLQVRCREAAITPTSKDEPAATIPVEDPAETSEPEPTPTPKDFNFGESTTAASAPKASIPFAIPTTPPADHLEQLIFGNDLWIYPSFQAQRQLLLQGLTAGESEALNLVGQLLVFRGAPPDRLPGLLKEVGEAYYRWQPHVSHNDDPLRDELAGWLQRKCDEAGSPNTIELVRPGDRYDNRRHHAKERGVEVAHVRGWVVLRENGKVYTKASVTVK